MSDGFPNKPRILRGAFVEFGLSLPPLAVVFQFNPMQLTRNRSLTFTAPNPQNPVGGRPVRPPRRSGRCGSSTVSSPTCSTCRRSSW